MRARPARRRWLAFLTAFAAGAASAQVAPDAPSDCDACAAWNVPIEPFRIFGNTYYVGTAELSAILIADDAGMVLLDAALPQSAALIDASIAALGFRTADIELIVSSHTHFDHAGGIRALQRASGATVAASPPAAEALRTGKPSPDDPQFTVPGNDFPPVAEVKVIRDGESLAVGDLRLTAHFTPGHTPGGTTWSWRSCEASRCLDLVYADSLNPVSADEFRFTGGATTPSIVETFERSIETVAQLPCDILLSPHPGFFGMQEKVQRRAEGARDAFVDSGACRRYAAAARVRLEQRVAQERASSGSR